MEGELVCLNCSNGTMMDDTRPYEYIYKGVKTVIPDVKGKWCRVCGDAWFGPEESRRVSEAMRAHKQAVNATTVDPAFIADVRKKLGLSQQEAAEAFGGGINAFSRYERGKTRPPIALVKLFSILNKHPELLDDIR